MNTREDEGLEWPRLLVQYIDRVKSPGGVTLPAFLCLVFLSFREKRRLFGANYVRVGDRSDVLGLIFEIGAFIGSRSGGDLDALGKLGSNQRSDIDSVDWGAVATVVRIRNSVFEDNFVDPPRSVAFLHKAVSWILYDVGYPSDSKRLLSVLRRKVSLNDQTIDDILSDARFSFELGVGFALFYPNLYARIREIEDSEPLDGNFQHNSGRSPSLAQSNQADLDAGLGLCLEWARLSRPDLAYVLDKMSSRDGGQSMTPREAPGHVDTFPNVTRSDRAQSIGTLTRVDCQRMGLPSRLSVILEQLATSGDITNVGLPWFLLLAYVSDYLTRDSSGKEILDFKYLFTSFGAICEVGGVIGQTTEVEPLELLSQTLVLPNPSESVDEYWRAACLTADESLEAYLKAFGTDPPGLLPLHVAASFLLSGNDYPNDVDTIRLQHVFQVNFWDHSQARTLASYKAFATGIALARNHAETFAGKHGVYTEEHSDLGTTTYKNPQSVINDRVGSRFSREGQLHLCRVWSELCRPEAKPIFREAA